MKKLFLFVVCLLFVRGAFAWGQKGHDVTAYIAECHLTEEAAEKIDKILGGHSLVYYANWMDSASHTPKFAYTKTWHYLNVDEGKTLDDMERNPNGDVVWAVNKLVKDLQSHKLSEEEEATALKMLIHLVGDMHCPMHAGRLIDKGGNKRPVKMFSRNTNLHSIWDTSLPESAHKWSYSEWQEQIDRLTGDEMVMIQEGTPEDWFKETHKICTEIYDFTPEGAYVSYDYIDKYAPVVELQFLRAGHRLAKLLNEIYK